MTFLLLLTAGTLHGPDHAERRTRAREQEPTKATPSPTWGADALRRGFPSSPQLGEAVQLLKEREGKARRE